VAQVLSDPFAAPAPRDRLRSEDLLADLFEAMHDLHFVRDALEGGEFCLSLAMEKVPARAGIVHLFDINRREFVVTSTRGTGVGKLLARRHPESDAVLIAAMRKRRAIVLDSASDAASIARYADIGGIFSLIVAPVMQAGRFLGVIELADPLDGRPFTEFEGTAIFYLAEQFAELVGKIGVVVDPEAIGARALPEA
jgi:GAF domain-containing protein